MASKHRYDPTVDGPLNYPYELVRRFATDGDERNRIKLNEYSKYLVLKADWRRCPELNPPAENSRELGERVLREQIESERPRSYSQAELVARAKWPEATIRRMLNGDYFGTSVSGIGLGEYAKNDPAGYAQLQLAMASHGIGGKSVAQAEERLLEVSRIPEPVKIENRHRLEPKLKDKFDIPGEVDDRTLEAAAAAAEQLAKEEAWKAIHDKAAEM